MLFILKKPALINKIMT